MNERKLFQEQSNIKYNNIKIKLCKSIRDNQKKFLKRNNRGITLIALVISIIVMLILAGVSLNAVIGDNGIITQAQNATYMQSVAVLEEFLNSYYVEHYDNFANEESKVQTLKNLEPNWFFSGAPLGYIVDSNGGIHFYINKDGLPNNIKSQLKGGDAGDKTYSAYASMEDVYGVTKDLKVYYCKDTNNVFGTAEYDLDDSNRVVFEANSDMAKLITGNNTDEVTAGTARSIKNLTITNENQIKNLTELYNLPSLQELTLKNVQMESLSGLENAPSIVNIIFENCNIKDYSAMQKINKLQKLYIIKSNNDEINKLFTAMKETDYTSLNTLAVVGDDRIIEHKTSKSEDLSTNRSEVSNIDILKELTSSTKNSIKNLFLNNNNISDISAISDFVNITLVRLDRNNLTSLRALEKMQNLNYVYAAYNNLGTSEIYDMSLENFGKNETEDAIASLKGKTNIILVDLRDNVNLKWISYIKDSQSIETLNLLNCKNLVGNDLAEIKSIIIKAGNNASIPAEYSLLLLDENLEKLDLSNQKITKDNFLTLSGYSKIKWLKLENLTLTDTSGNKISSEDLNTTLNTVLKTLPNLTNLSLRAASSNCNISEMNNIEFIKNCKNIGELDIRGTRITTGTPNGNGLELLNSNATKIHTLRIDNEAIDVSLLQTTISRLQAGRTGNNIYYSSGFCCEKSSLYKQLENCTEITKLNVYDYNCPNYNLDTLDLSRCTKLTSVYLRYFNQTKNDAKIIFPSTLKSINWEGTYGYFSLTPSNNSINLSDFTLQLAHTTQENFNKIIDNFTNINANISVFYIREATKINSLSKIGECLNLNIETLKVGYNNASSTRFNFQNLDDFKNVKGLTNIEINRTNIKDISAVANFSSLNSLYIYDSKVESLKGIENLANLTSITVKKNNLTNVKGIENLKNLVSLNLEENCLYDTFSEKDETGNLITYNNLNIIANLHTKNGGSLKNIYLNGNPGIIDFSILSKLSWENKTGF